MASQQEDVTQLLVHLNEGDPAAGEQLMRVVYDELRRIAARFLRRERENHTLQTTALVHEAYLRLVDESIEWKNRSHFFGIAAENMRRILIEYARSRNAAKRGGGARPVSLDEGIDISDERASDLLALDDALTALAEFDPAKARLVELRFFAGLTVAETAAVLGTSEATINRQWRLARAWLGQEMSEGGAPTK